MKITDNTIEQILEQMGKTYRSWEPRRQRVEATWNFLVHELNSAEAPVMVTAEPRFSFSFRPLLSLFHIQTLRPVIAVLVLGIFGVGSLLHVASASLPGDTLYTIKLVKEHAQVQLAADDTARAKLSVQFAVNRADELRQVVKREESRDVKAERLSVAVSGLQERVSAVTNTLVGLSDKKEFAAVAEDGAEQIVFLLSQADSDAASNNGVIAKEVSQILKEMTETKQLISLGANPPAEFVHSVVVAAMQPTVAPMTDAIHPTNLGRQKSVGQSAQLINPAQSIFSLPVAQSVTSIGILPLAESIQSAP